jgi:hypothetical protein
MVGNFFAFQRADEIGFDPQLEPQLRCHKANSAINLELMCNQEAQISSLSRRCLQVPHRAPPPSVRLGTQN